MDDPYDPTWTSGIMACALPTKVQKLIAQKLDVPSNIGHDFRSFAERLGYSADQIKQLDHLHIPTAGGSNTMKIFHQEHLEGIPLKRLWDIFAEMDRKDVLRILNDNKAAILQQHLACEQRLQLQKCKMATSPASYNRNYLPCDMYSTQSDTSQVYPPPAYGEHTQHRQSSEVYMSNDTEPKTIHPSVPPNAGSIQRCSNGNQLCTLETMHNSRQSSNYPESSRNEEERGVPSTTISSQPYPLEYRSDSISLNLTVNDHEILPSEDTDSTRELSSESIIRNHRTVNEAPRERRVFIAYDLDINKSAQKPLAKIWKGLRDAGVVAHFDQYKETSGYGRATILLESRMRFTEANVIMVLVTPSYQVAIKKGPTTFTIDNVCHKSNADSVYKWMRVSGTGKDIILVYANGATRNNVPRVLLGLARREFTYPADYDRIITTLSDPDSDILNRNSIEC